MDGESFRLVELKVHLLAFGVLLRDCARVGNLVQVFPRLEGGYEAAPVRRPLEEEAYALSLPV
jgi:hypothetical protein